MAMPSVLPPPELPLVEQVRALAEQMAGSVSCSLADVLRRTKSRSWMLGRLKRLCVGRTDEEIRDAIVALSKQHRPTDKDEQLERLSASQPEETRPPLHGLEPSSWPIWSGRAEQLAPCIVYPMEMPELLRRSSVRLRWARNLTIQAVAAAEDVGELWWDGQFWQRTAERIIVANQKTKTKRIQRHLPVALKPDDQAELSRRIADIDAEREALEAELANETKRLRAAIKGRLDAREGVIDSMKTGRQTQLVECEERWQYDVRQVTVVRKDTGDVLETREMTKEELQLQLPETTASG